jgi:hypothetical protein
MTDVERRNELTTGAKAFLWVAGVISALHLIDFAFHGWKITDLLVAVGFALMGYGTYENGLRRFREEVPPPDKRAHIASGVGVVLALGATLARHLL